MQDLAEDAFAVLNAAGLDSADVYGVSMGGMVALEMALSRPERVTSLILGCTAARCPPGRARNPLLYWLPKSLAVTLGKGVLYGSAADPARVAEDMALLRADRSDRRGLIAQAQAVAGFDVLDRLDEIRQPTLVLHGNEDRIIPLAMGAELAAGIAGSRLVVLEGSGHNYVADATRASNDAVLQFLKSVA